MGDSGDRIRHFYPALEMEGSQQAARYWLRESVRQCERQAGLAICCCPLWGLGKCLDLYLARQDHLSDQAQAD